MSMPFFSFVSSLASILDFNLTQGDVISQLEQLGHRVGESLVERVCKDNPRFRTELDAMVFLAKQFWVTLFNKQADHLKTNKQVRTVASGTDQIHYRERY